MAYRETRSNRGRAADEVAAQADEAFNDYAPTAADPTTLEELVAQKKAAGKPIFAQDLATVPHNLDDINRLEQEGLLDSTQAGRSRLNLNARLSAPETAATYGTDTPPKPDTKSGPSLGERLTDAEGPTQLESDRQVGGGRRASRQVVYSNENIDAQAAADGPRTGPRGRGTEMPKGPKGRTPKIDTPPATSDTEGTKVKSPMDPPPETPAPEPSPTETTPGKVASPMDPPPTRPVPEKSLTAPASQEMIDEVAAGMDAGSARTDDIIAAVRSKLTEDGVTDPAVLDKVDDLVRAEVEAMGSSTPPEIIGRGVQAELERRNLVPPRDVPGASAKVGSPMDPPPGADTTPVVETAPKAVPEAAPKAVPEAAPKAVPKVETTPVVETTPTTPVPEQSLTAPASQQMVDEVAAGMGKTAPTTPAAPAARTTTDALTAEEQARAAAMADLPKDTSPRRFVVDAEGGATVRPTARPVVPDRAPLAGERSAVRALQNDAFNLADDLAGVEYRLPSHPQFLADLEQILQAAPEYQPGGLNLGRQMYFSQLGELAGVPYSGLNAEGLPAAVRGNYYVNNPVARLLEERSLPAVYEPSTMNVEGAAARNLGPLRPLTAQERAVRDLITQIGEETPGTALARRAALVPYEEAAAGAGSAGAGSAAGTAVSPYQPRNYSIPGYEVPGTGGPIPGSGPRFTASAGGAGGGGGGGVPTATTGALPSGGGGGGGSIPKTAAGLADDVARTPKFASPGSKFASLGSKILTKGGPTGFKGAMAGLNAGMVPSIAGMAAQYIGGRLDQPDTVDRSESFDAADAGQFLKGAGSVGVGAGLGAGALGALGLSLGPVGWWGVGLGALGYGAYKMLQTKKSTPEQKLTRVFNSFKGSGMELDAGYLADAKSMYKSYVESGLKPEEAGAAALQYLQENGRSKLEETRSGSLGGGPDAKTLLAIQGMYAKNLADSRARQESYLDAATAATTPFVSQAGQFSGLAATNMLQMRAAANQMNEQMANAYQMAPIWDAAKQYNADQLKNYQNMVNAQQAGQLSLGSLMAPTTQTMLAQQPVGSSPLG